MLPAHLVADNGLCCIEEYPQIRSNLRRDVGDLDVAASYPNGGSTLNVSKETTAKEIVKIEGIDEDTQRAMSLNLNSGHTNAVEICCNLFGMPTLTQLLDAFREDITKSDNTIENEFN